jgi:c-di-GMP-binding flagellar brake protein YcgR
MFTASSIDISAGGAKIMISQEYPSGTLIKMVLLLSEQEEIELEAVVIRCGIFRKSELSQVVSCWISVRFQSITDQQRKKIRKFIYKQQELRVKSLI